MSSTTKPELPPHPEVWYEYKASGSTLAEFHRDKSRVRVLIGPLGSGKTTGALVEVLRLCNSHPPMKVQVGELGVRKLRVAIVRNSAVDLKSSTIKDWQEAVPPQFGVPVMASPITHRLRYLHADQRSRVEAEVLFLGFDELRDVRKIRGLQLTWLLIDEAKEMGKPVVDMLMGRVGRYPARRVQGDYPYGTVMITNAFERDHWLYKLKENPPPGWKFFVQPGGVIKRSGVWVPNPDADNLVNLPPNYYQDQLAGKREDWIRSNLANEFVFVADGRPVHPDFSEQLHVAEFELEPDPTLDTIYLGQDWGRTPAMVVAQQSPSGQWRILDEIIGTNTSAYPFGQRARQLLNQKYEGLLEVGWGDPSGTSGAQTREENCFDVLAETGIMLDPTFTNSFEIRSAAVDAVLRKLIGGKPALLISPNCKTLIRGLAGGYYFRRMQVSSTELYSDEPVKTDESHVCEALQYLLVGAGEAPTGGGSSNEFTSKMRVIEEEFGGWYPAQRNFA